MLGNVASGRRQPTLRAHGMLAQPAAPPSDPMHTYVNATGGPLFRVELAHNVIPDSLCASKRGLFVAGKELTTGLMRSVFVPSVGSSVFVDDNVS